MQYTYQALLLTCIRQGCRPESSGTTPNDIVPDGEFSSLLNVLQHLECQSGTFKEQHCTRRFATLDGDALDVDPGLNTSPALPLPHIPR